jgi:outer membrane protein assembly factor BamB
VFSSGIVRNRAQFVRAVNSMQRSRHLTFGWAFVALLLANGLSRAQQPRLLIFGGPAPHAELTAPQVNAVSGTIASRLEQARALAAARNWDEAVDIYRELADGKTDRVVALGDGRFVNLRTYCQLELARLPAEALSAYRRRVDPLAERSYREGLAARDEQQLNRVVEELFCSSWGDDVLLALGDLALERADYDGARRRWEQISPQLRDPSGRSLWQALHGIDLNARWPEVDRRWHTRKGPPDWLAYPDSTIDLADIRARLIVASIRAGELDRAAFELEAFRHWHPDATGQIGGQEGPYVAALEKLLASAREWKPIPPQSDWPTFAGAQTRAALALPIGPTLLPAWEQPIELSPPMFPRRIMFMVQGGAPPVNPHESGRPLSCYPTVVDGIVLFADAVGIHAADLATGKPAITADGVIFRDETPTPEQQPGQLPFVAGTGVAHGVPRLTLNVVEHTVFGRIGALATSHSELSHGPAGDRIVGLNLRREGLLTFRARPDDGEWSFDGTPVGDGRRLYVAMRHGGASPQAYVAAFDATSGSQLWRTSIGSADTPAGGLGDEITHDLLTLAGGRIYFNTNLGLVAALDANSGEIAWLAKYPRWTGKSFMPGQSTPLHFDRDPSPCLVRDGLVIVAPSDTPDVFALDAETGKTLWVNSQMAEATQLLGVVGQRLIVSGNRLASLDWRSGQTTWIWPESSTAGIRGMGRGLIAGDEVFWPTRSDIYVVNPETGARTRSPISLSPVSDCGANLAAAGGQLVVAGYDKLLAYGTPMAAAPDRKQQNTSGGAVRTGRLSDQSKTE